MRSQRNRRRWLLTILAAALAAMVYGASDAQAQQAASGDFTIKATFDTWWWDELDGDTSWQFSANGAIRDSGTFGDTGFFPDESGWRQYTFYGAHGEFHLGPLPSWLQEGVEYPVEVLPGTGAYADIAGIAVVTARIRYRQLWWYDPCCGRTRYTYRVVSWTVDGVLVP